MNYEQIDFQWQVGNRMQFQLFVIRSLKPVNAENSAKGMRILRNNSAITPQVQVTTKRHGRYLNYQQIDFSMPQQKAISAVAIRSLDKTMEC